MGHCKIFIVACFLATGCGSAPRRVPDYHVRGASVVLGDELTRGAGMTPMSLERSIAAAEVYWQATFDLTGWQLSFYHQPVPCGDVLAGGCFDRKWMTIDVDWLGYSCPESGVLWHELGHFLYQGHPDSRFWDVFFTPFPCEEMRR